MFKKLLIIFVVAASVFAQEGVWSNSSDAMSEEEVKKVLQPFKKNELTHLSFVDDLEKSYEETKYQRNIFVLGFSYGYVSGTETVSTARNSQDYSSTAHDIKAIIGKDFSLWHSSKIQPVRIQFEYDIAFLDTDTKISSYFFTLKENFSYWSFYETQTSKVFPFMAFKLGNTFLTSKTFDTKGFSYGYELGVNYQYKMIEYGLSYEYTINKLDHPVDGVVDVLAQNKLLLTLNYKFMKEGY